MDKQAKITLIALVLVGILFVSLAAAASKKECNDHIDNDGDGAIDLADSGCDGPQDTDETNCGDGVCEGGEDPLSCPADCCAQEGESPTNFDYTTGEYIPGGEACCEGLNEIGPRTSQSALDMGICMEVSGGPGTCWPCGDSICNPEYEDSCNCPEDCGVL